MASYTRYLVHPPQSPTAATTASTDFIQSSNSGNLSISNSEAEKVFPLYQLNSISGYFSLSIRAATVNIGSAARLLFRSSPIFLPDRLFKRGASPLRGMGSASAQGLRTS